MNLDAFIARLTPNVPNPADLKQRYIRYVAECDARVMLDEPGNDAQERITDLLLDANPQPYELMIDEQFSNMDEEEISAHLAYAIEAFGEQPDLHLFAVEPRPVNPFVALAQRIALLNPDAGEIGPGMLASLIADARAALGQ